MVDKVIKRKQCDRCPKVYDPDKEEQPELNADASVVAKAYSWSDICERCRKTLNNKAPLLQHGGIKDAQSDVPEAPSEPTSS